MAETKNENGGQRKKYTPKMLQVLETARHVFLREGFEATSMDMLAQESGVARRTIYNQFTSKENLFRAVVERIWFRLSMPDLPTGAAMTDNPRASLRQIGLTLARYWAPPETQDFLRLIIREGERFPHLAEDFYRMSKAPMLAHMLEYFAQLEKQKIMTFEDKELAVHQFVGLVMEPLRGLSLIGIGDVPGEARYQQVVNEAVNMFFARYQSAG